MYIGNKTIAMAEGDDEYFWASGDDWGTLKVRVSLRADDLY